MADIETWVPGLDGRQAGQGRAVIGGPGQPLTGLQARWRGLCPRQIARSPADPAAKHGVELEENHGGQGRQDDQFENLQCDTDERRAGDESDLI